MSKKLASLSMLFTEYLHACKNAGLHWVQPGRFVLPGELEGAPVLQFFPCRNPYGEDKPAPNSNYSMLKARYEEYQNKVVKAFYKNYFATFDRQIVLVDCLSPLNDGYGSFLDMRRALEQIMHSFRYGRNGLLKRLFAPDSKVLLPQPSGSCHPEHTAFGVVTAADGSSCLASAPMRILR